MLGELTQYLQIERPHRVLTSPDDDVIKTQRGKEAMVEHTDTDHSPWTSIKSNDKKRARINAMRFFLHQFDYEDKNPSVVSAADPLIVMRGRNSIRD